MFGLSARTNMARAILYQERTSTAVVKDNGAGTVTLHPVPPKSAPLGLQRVISPIKPSSMQQAD